MTPTAENKLIGSGCLVALVGTIVSVYCATHINWIYGTAAVLLLPIWIIISRSRANAENQINRKALQDIIQSTGQVLPTLQRSGRYGYPHFTLIFPSRRDLYAAETAGSIAAFKAFLQDRYGDFGGKTRPFDAEAAVDVTYKTETRA